MEGNRNFASFENSFTDLYLGGTSGRSTENGAPGCWILVSVAAGAAAMIRWWNRQRQRFPIYRERICGTERARARGKDRKTTDPYLGQM